MLGAWKEFLAGKRKRRDVQEFSKNLLHNILILYEELMTGRYRHSAYEAFKIADPKSRDIHKATVRDRLVHHAIYRKLYPYFDARFIVDSYSCRIEKGTHRAMNRFREFARKESCNHTKTVWVLKCDIRKFFASVNHSVLLHIIDRSIADKSIMALLTEIIHSFKTPISLAFPAGKASDTCTGLPLGNLTSQLLVNIYMNEFDQFVKHTLKAKYYIRYGDDFVILSNDREWLENLLPQIRYFLRVELRVALHPKKVSICTVASGVDFLGWIHFPDHRVLRTTTKRRMLRRVVGIEEGSPMLQSYLGLLAHGNGYLLQKKIRKMSK